MTYISPDVRIVPPARAAMLAAAVASLGMAPVTHRILGYLLNQFPKRWVTLLILALPLLLLAIIAIRFRMLVGAGLTGTGNRLDQNRDRDGDSYLSRDRLCHIRNNGPSSLDARCCC